MDEWTAHFAHYSEPERQEGGSPRPKMFPKARSQGATGQRALNQRVDGDSDSPRCSSACHPQPADREENDR